MVADFVVDLLDRLVADMLEVVVDLHAAILLIRQQLFNQNFSQVALLRRFHSRFLRVLVVLEPLFCLSEVDFPRFLFGRQLRVLSLDLLHHFLAFLDFGELRRYPIFERPALELKFRIENLVLSSKVVLLGLNSFNEDFSFLNEQLVFFEYTLVVNDPVELFLIEMSHGHELKNLFSIRLGLEHVFNPVNQLNRVFEIGLLQAFEDAVGFEVGHPPR